MIISFTSDHDPVAHFVGFPDADGRRFVNAVQVFRRPALHRFWDQRARREIADGDVIVRRSRRASAGPEVERRRPVLRP
jgi:hypothetical protein